MMRYRSWWTRVKEEIAINLLKEKAAPELVSKATGLSMERVLELQASLGEGSAD